MINSSKPSPRRFTPKLPTRQLCPALQSHGPKTRRRRNGRKRNHPSLQLRILRKSPRPTPLSSNPIYGRKTFPSRLPVKTMPPFKRRTSSAYSAKHDEPAEKVKRLRLADSFEKACALQMGKNLKKAKTTVGCMFAGIGGFCPTFQEADDSTLWATR